MSAPDDDRALEKRKRKAAYRRQASAAASKLPRLGRGGHPGRLAPGRRGLLITCNKRERECVGEAYDLLDTFMPPGSDGVHGGDDNDDVEEGDGDDDDDIQGRIEREKLASGGARASAQPAFEQLRTQVANCVFIGVSRPAERLPWLFSVTDAVFEAATVGGPRGRGVGGRHILRLLPVEATCVSGLDDIAEAFGNVWSKFVADGDVQAERPTFTVNFKARNFDKLDRQKTIDRIFSAVKAASPAWSVNHGLADVVIDVNVLQKVTCLSLLRRFRRYHKYNLSEVALGAVAAGAEKANAGAETADAGAEKADAAAEKAGAAAEKAGAGVANVEMAGAETAAAVAVADAAERPEAANAVADLAQGVST